MTKFVDSATFERHSEKLVLYDQSRMPDAKVGTEVGEHSGRQDAEDGFIPERLMPWGREQHRSFRHEK